MIKSDSQSSLDLDEEPKAESSDIVALALVAGFNLAWSKCMYV